MKPSDCKTRAQAVAAGNGVHEARVVHANLHQWGRKDVFERIDQALYDLEVSFWRRADELSKKKAPTRPASRKGRKR